MGLSATSRPVAVTLPPESGIVPQVAQFDESVPEPKADLRSIVAYGGIPWAFVPIYQTPGPTSSTTTPCPQAPSRSVKCSPELESPAGEPLNDIAKSAVISVARSSTPRSIKKNAPGSIR